MLMRSRVPELMDDPELDPKAHLEALRGLEALNSVSRNTDLLWQELSTFFNRSEASPLRVLDLATGGGDTLIALDKRARREKLAVEFVGADISPTAVEHANKRARLENSRAKFISLNVLEDALPNGFDIVMTSLFTHHLDPPQVIELLKRMSGAAKEMVLVNDLVRSDLSLALVWLATRLFSRSKIVHYDGPVSVRAAFTPDEMRSMGVKAGLGSCSVKRCPPCRQMLIWRAK